MTNIFTTVLIISLQTTIAAAVILFIKKAFAAKINVRISYLLWVPVLLRLLFPVLPSSPLSIFNATYLDFGSKISITAAPVSNARVESPDSPSLPQSGNKNGVSTVAGTDGSYENSGMSAESETGNSTQKSALQNIPAFLSYIWAAGVLLAILYLFLVNLLFALKIKSMHTIELPEALLKKLKSAIRISRPVKFVESTEVASPCVFGTVNPVVILPKGLLDNIDENTLYHVLAHEFAHIKRCDLSMTWLVSILCAIHWFNPVLWYCSKLIRRDQELCADAYAMSHLIEDDILGYGQTLLSIVKNAKTQPFALMAAGITENKNTIKQRIKNIAAFSKKKYRLTFIGVVLILAAGIILCTSGIDYPKTAEESMEFSDNIMMSFTSNNAGDQKSFELRIYNHNKPAINNCSIEIYNGNPYQSGSDPVFSSKNFRVAGQKYKSFNLENIDYNSAYIKFSYRVGFSLSKLNRNEQAGDIQMFDKTAEINGWTAASDAEIDSFIEENGLQAAAITRIYDFYTIVMFQNGDASGYYELYKDAASGDLRSRRIIGYGSNGSEQPVRMLGGTANGNYPFINFIINSPAILALGDKIEIQAAGGTITAGVSGQAAHTVETRGYGSIDKILIYDKNGKLIYDGEKALFKDVSFRPSDPDYLKVTGEKGYKIVNQSPMSFEVSFTHGMFPNEYTVAYKSEDIDLKIPLFTYENTTVYLKSIVESNESPDYLYANFYFVHDIDNKPGNILSGQHVNFEANGEHSYGSNVMPQKDASAPGFGILKNATSLRSSGPGDQIAIYLDRSMVEKTSGNFTVTLDGLNLISYVTDSAYIPFNEEKKAQIRDMVYNQVITLENNKEKLTGNEEVYATVGLKGQQVFDTGAKKFVDISGRYVYCVVFHTEADGLLGPITTFVGPKTEKIIGQLLRE